MAHRYTADLWLRAPLLMLLQCVLVTACTATAVSRLCSSTLLRRECRPDTCWSASRPRAESLSVLSACDSLVSLAQVCSREKTRTRHSAVGNGNAAPSLVNEVLPELLCFDRHYSCTEACLSSDVWGAIGFQQMTWHAAHGRAPSRLPQSLCSCTAHLLGALSKHNRGYTSSLDTLNSASVACPVCSLQTRRRLRQGQGDSHAGLLLELPLKLARPWLYRIWATRRSAPLRVPVTPRLLWVSDSRERRYRLSRMLLHSQAGRPAMTVPSSASSCASDRGPEQGSCFA